MNEVSSNNVAFSLPSLSAKELIVLFRWISFAQCQGNVCTFGAGYKFQSTNRF